MLTWSAVVPTYMRGQILPTSLRLMASQTRPPAAIVVMDASPNWTESRDQVMASVATSHPNVRWIYDRARRASSAAQRNQGIDRTGSDVVLFIDDDCLMYPDCAAELLRIYEADHGSEVAGVAAILVPQPPGSADESSHPRGARKHHQPFLRRNVRRLLRADDIFVPYEATSRQYAIPSHLRALDVGLTPTMPGGAMSFRRQMLERERFAEFLDRYAAGEDSDLSHRISRHGMLLNAHRARVHHVAAHGGKLSVFASTALGALNPLVLHASFGSDRAYSSTANRHLLRRRFAIQLLKDLNLKSWTLPRARGILFALRRLDEVFAQDPAKLHAWYRDLQARLIGSDSGEEER